MRRDVVSRARELVGVRYKHRGRDKRGIDCIGVSAYAAQIDFDSLPEVIEANASIDAYFHENGWSFRRGDPNHLKAVELFHAGLTKYLLSVIKDDLQIGDFLLLSMKTAHKVYGDHLAVYSGRGRMIHADLKRGVIEEQIDQKHVQRLRSIWRLKG